MGYFAHINENSVVTTVIVADQEFINTGAEGDPADWIETSIDGSFRKQYAGIGYTYDAEADVFICPQPYPSWILDSNYDWVAVPITTPLLYMFSCDPFHVNTILYQTLATVGSGAKRSL